MPRPFLVPLEKTGFEVPGRLRIYCNVFQNVLFGHLGSQKIILVNKMTVVDTIMRYWPTKDSLRL